MTRFLALFILFLSSAKAHGAEKDSVLNRAMTIEYDYPDSAIALVQQRLASGGLSKKDESAAYEIMGIANWVQENYAEAIAAHSQALEIRKSINYASGVGYSYNNLGLSYQDLGSPKLAMQHFLEAQSIGEMEKDSSLIANVLGNIGTLYEEQGDIENALEYYGKSLAILESGTNQRVLGNTLNNIAVVYQQLNELEKARNFILRSLTIRQAIDDKFGIAQSLNFLGLIESGAGNLSVSDSLFRASLTVYNALENHWGQSMVYGNLGADANAVNQFLKGAEYCGLSFKIANQFQLEWKESACQCLAEAYTGLGEIDTASYYWKRLVAIKDSIRQENALSEISLVQKRFEFEKEQLKAEAEIARQKALRKAAFGLGMMGIALFFVAFRSYRIKQKDNELLEEKNHKISQQKEVIEEKNLHITDSINYAQNLQSAMLPKHAAFAEHFSDYHIFYKPKDIVSGDFYWMEEAHGLVFLAAADCTGHGVPGAMVSMVGFQGLNKAVLEEKRTSPAAILQRLSDHVEKAFDKSGGSVKDGMDICLVAIDTKTRTVTYSGAHNALWILTSNEELPNAKLREETNGKRMFELKADRRSIGGFMDAGAFTEETVQLNQGDRLFLFSDGFADQFGGPQGKKMGSKRMRNLFREKALQNQLKSIDSEFEKWKGEEEQVDDVTVISVTV